MLRLLLAILILAGSVPAAEAARRDDTKRAATSSSAQSQPARSAAARSTPARSTPARATPSRATPAREATKRQAGRGSSTLRPGDVRTSRSGEAARGASAAAVPRNVAASCTRRNGRTVCSPATIPVRSSIAGWQSGLPTASYAQRECPEGTLATLARGHDDVVRCMPL